MVASLEEMQQQLIAAKRGIVESNERSAKAEAIVDKSITVISTLVAEGKEKDIKIETVTAEKEKAEIKIVELEAEVDLLKPFGDSDEESDRDRDRRIIKLSMETLGNASVKMVFAEAKPRGLKRGIEFVRTILNREVEAKHYVKYMSGSTAFYIATSGGLHRALVRVIYNTSRTPVSVVAQEEGIKALALETLVTAVNEFCLSRYAAKLDCEKVMVAYKHLSMGANKAALIETLKPKVR